jgi:hypothetical protein
VANFLSEEWFEQIGAARADGDGAPVTLVLQHTVTGTPYGEVCYHVRLSPGRVEIVRGPAPAADVTFAEEYATAAAIAGGSLPAPAALLAGAIRVGGDLAALLAHQDVLAADDPIPASVRAETAY